MHTIELERICIVRSMCNAFILSAKSTIRILTNFINYNDAL